MRTGQKNAVIIPKTVKRMRERTESGKLTREQLNRQRIECPSEESPDLAYITTYGILRDTGKETYRYVFPKKFREVTTCKKKDIVVNLTPQKSAEVSYEFLTENGEVKGILIKARDFGRMNVRVAGARYDLRDRENYRESLFIN